MNNTNPLYSLQENSHLKKMLRAKTLQDALGRGSTLEQQLIDGKENSKKIAKLIKGGMRKDYAQTQVIGHPTSAPNPEIRKYWSSRDRSVNSARRYISDFGGDYRYRGGIYTGDVVHKPQNKTIDRIINAKVNPYKAGYEGDAYGQLKADRAKNAVDVQTRIAQDKGFFSPERRKLRRLKRIYRRALGDIQPASVFD